MSPSLPFPCSGFLSLSKLSSGPGICDKQHLCKIFLTFGITISRFFYWSLSCGAVFVCWHTKRKRTKSCSIRPNCRSAALRIAIQAIQSMCICLQHTAYCVEKMIHSPKVRRAHFLFSFRLLLWPKLARPHNSSEKFPNVTFQAKLGSLCTFLGGFQQYFNGEKNAFHLSNNSDRPPTEWIFHGNLSKSVRACNLCVIHGWAAAEQEEQQHLAWRLLQLLSFVLLLLLPKDNHWQAW